MGFNYALKKKMSEKVAFPVTLTVQQFTWVTMISRRYNEELKIHLEGSRRVKFIEKNKK